MSFESKCSTTAIIWTNSFINPAIRVACKYCVARIHLIRARDFTKHTICTHLREIKRCICCCVLCRCWPKRLAIIYQTVTSFFENGRGESCFPSAAGPRARRVCVAAHHNSHPRRLKSRSRCFLQRAQERCTLGALACNTSRWVHPFCLCGTTALLTHSFAPSCAAIIIHAHMMHV